MRDQLALAPTSRNATEQRSSERRRSAAGHAPVLLPLRQSHHSIVALYRIVITVVIIGIIAKFHGTRFPVTYPWQMLRNLRGSWRQVGNGLETPATSYGETGLVETGLHGQQRYGLRAFNIAA